MLSGDAGRPTWGFLPLENLEQVEVVKGASSVLYGSSALSGVIQFRTAFPDPEPLTRVTVQHGVHSNPGNGRKYWNRSLMQSSTSWLHTRRLNNGDGISFGGQWLGSRRAQRAPNRSQLPGCPTTALQPLYRGPL